MRSTAWGQRRYPWILTSTSGLESDPIDPIDIELRHGIEIDDLSEIRPDPESRTY